VREPGFLPPPLSQPSLFQHTNIVFLATGEPAGNLWRATEHDYSPDSDKSARTNAALISLVRNEELGQLLDTMRDLERTWNSKFNYPYIFFNDIPFTEEFKQKVQSVTKAKCQFGTSSPSVPLEEEHS
jgi:hypothetical protein